MWCLKFTGKFNFPAVLPQRKQWLVHKIQRCPPINPRVPTLRGPNNPKVRQSEGPVVRGSDSRRAWYMPKVQYTRIHWVCVCRCRSSIMLLVTDFCFKVLKPDPWDNFSHFLQPSSQEILSTENSNQKMLIYVESNYSVTFLAFNKICTDWNIHA